MNRIAVTILAATATTALVGGGLYLGHARDGNTVDPVTSTLPATVLDVEPTKCATSSVGSGKKTLAIKDVWPNGGGTARTHQSIEPAECGKAMQAIEGGNLLAPHCEMGFPWQSGRYREATFSLLGVSDVQTVTLISDKNQTITETIVAFRTPQGRQAMLSNAEQCGGTNVDNRWTIPEPNGSVVISTVPSNTLVAIKFENVTLSKEKKTKLIERAETLVTGSL